MTLTSADQGEFETSPGTNMGQPGERRAGACGSVLKGADRDQMRRAIRAVAQGEAQFGPDVAVQLTSFLAR